MAWSLRCPTDGSSFVDRRLTRHRPKRASLKERYPELAGADANEDAVAPKGNVLLRTLKEYQTAAGAKSLKDIVPP